MITQDNDGLDNPDRLNTQTPHGARARAGLSSLGDALAAAGVESAATTERAKIIAGRYWRRLHRARGVTTSATPDKLQPAIDLAARALQASGEVLGDAAAWRAIDYALFTEQRGAFNLALSRAGAAKLARRMRASGKHVSPAAEADGAAAGVLALIRWQSTGLNADNAPEVETRTARVAWRAVVKEISRDTLGESIPLHTVSDDWLWHNAAQHDESRTERAARLKVERQATTRQLRLFRRLANLPCPNSKRAQVIEKVGNAASMLLTGLTLEAAATAAGFKARRAGAGRGQHSAGDAFCQALRRLGFQIRGHARQISKKEFATELWPRSI
jgi:hypothetical protein